QETVRVRQGDVAVERRAGAVGDLLRVEPGAARKGGRRRNEHEGFKDESVLDEIALDVESDASVRETIAILERHEPIKYAQRVVAAGVMRIGQLIRAPRTRFWTGALLNDA